MTRTEQLKQIYPMACAGDTRAMAQLHKLTRKKKVGDLCHCEICNSPIRFSRRGDGLRCAMHQKRLRSAQFFRRRLAPVLAILLLCLAVSAQTNGFIKLAWTPSPTTNVLGYNIYHSTNLLLPLTNWAKVATVTNITSSNTTLYFKPGEHWFFLTSYNAWLESDPSSVAGTPPPTIPAGASISVYGPTN